MEYKSFNFSELKQLDEGTFEGYGAVYGNLDLDNDIIEKDAFRQSIEKNDEVPILYGHSYQQLSSIIGLGKLRNDPEGVYVKGELLTNTESGRHAYECMKKGILKKMSVGFQLEKKARTKSGVRLIQKGSIGEMSIVLNPANPRASIEVVKSVRASIGCKRSYESVLRDLGFTRKEATTIASVSYHLIAKDSEDQSDSDMQNNQVIKYISNQLNKNTELLKGIVKCQNKK